MLQGAAPALDSNARELRWHGSFTRDVPCLSVGPPNSVHSLSAVTAERALTIFFSALKHLVTVSNVKRAERPTFLSCQFVDAHSPARCYAYGQATANCDFSNMTEA